MEIEENSIRKNASDSQKKRLSHFCPTRWDEKVTGLDNFEDLFTPFAFCLEEMSLNMEHVHNQDISTKATSFYKLMASFDFFLLWLLLGQFLINSPQN